MSEETKRVCPIMTAGLFANQHSAAMGMKKYPCLMEKCELWNEKEGCCSFRIPYKLI